MNAQTFYPTSDWNRWLVSSVVGWAFPTLPYVEAMAIYDQVAPGYQRIMTGSTGSSPFYNPYYVDGSSPLAIPQPAFICPSEPNAREPQEVNTNDGRQAVSCYRCCLGDYPVYSSAWQELHTPRGAYTAGGRRITTMASFVDGTSNTVLLAEGIVYNFNKQQNPVRGDLANVSGFGATSNIATCQAAARDPVDSKYFAGTFTVENIHEAPGRGYIIAWVPVTGFVCMMPPNSPFCTSASSNNGAIYGGCYNSLTASSYHSGGCNVALADGSVRFISETIDTGTASQTITSNYSNAVGASPWGVWGALGTIEGGETKAP